jgi:hypothetical protein
MAERPILLFGLPTLALKSKRGGGASHIQYPSHTRQTKRLAPKIVELQST